MACRRRGGKETRRINVMNRFLCYTYLMASQVVVEKKRGVQLRTWRRHFLLTYIERCLGSRWFDSVGRLRAGRCLLLLGIHREYPNKRHSARLVRIAFGKCFLRDISQGRTFDGTFVIIRVRYGGGFLYDYILFLGKSKTAM